MSNQTIKLGRPEDKPKKNLGARRMPYTPNETATRLRGSFQVGTIDGDGYENIVVHTHGTVTSPDGQIIASGPVEIPLDDRSAALLAAELINQLSGQYLTILYGGLDPQRGTIFKAFRHQFLQDVSDDVEAFDLAADLVR